MTEWGKPRNARILDGRAMAAEIDGETTGELRAIAAERGSMPQVRVVMCGDDAASAVYARRILKTAHRVGTSGELLELGAGSGADRIRATLRDVSLDPDVGGVILQLPLPGRLQASDVIGALDPRKDLDGIHPVNAGLVSRGQGGFAPSCAEAAVQILRRSDIPIAGRSAVVIGRSNVVGKPAQLLLIGESATVTVCHRQTRDVASILRQAEIIVVAAGSPGLIRGEVIAPGAVVIDCGINVDDDGRVVGDVDLDSVLPVAGAVTPVPGGVGPVTNAVLMNHLARAARAQLDGMPDNQPAETNVT
jgi:methylenetetrahydrofolate dehydrogenase (NADP+) / methenyltetrahydrofolate cyclohydrolase